MVPTVLQGGRGGVSQNTLLNFFSSLLSRGFFEVFLNE